MSTPTRRSLREQAAFDRESAGPTGAQVPSGAARRARRGIGRMLTDVLLWIAAIAGVVCMLLVVLALTVNITLIMFRTGSMSPTIPAGSVAVVQEVAASDIEVGDVVTVDRVGDLPVTHRVTSISPGASDAERVITMRGDANAGDDPYPYTVQTVRVVLFSVPGIASVIVAMGNPYVLGALTIAATALVVWAFWPRSSNSRHRATSEEHR
ncbi:signal peptidase I [Microbacterium phyllosphaerae]|uniref:signal peptidase I n=1 Tax=Microbacterium phyllosphaerae TaxID=124798 RepID=UPI003D64FBD3